MFGARVRASVSIFTLDAGYLAIDDVSYDAQSPLLAVTGATFDASAMTFGILESLIYLRSLNRSTTSSIPTIAPDWRSSMTWAGSIGK